MVRVRQTDKGKIFLSPIPLKGLHIVRTHREDLNAALCEFCICISHTRQLRAAMRSHKTAQESEDNGFASAKSGKAHRIFIYVCEFKIRGKLTGRDNVR